MSNSVKINKPNTGRKLKIILYGDKCLGSNGF